MALSAAAKVNLFIPIETIADKFCNTRPDDTVKLYKIAISNARKFASRVTCGAEDLAMVHEVRVPECRVK